jgi:hypothetical protein
VDTKKTCGNGPLARSRTMPPTGITSLIGFLLFVVMHSQGDAQLCTLHGRVVEAESREPMELVNVFLANTTCGTSTDVQGAFILTDVPPGDYEIVVSRVGYVRVTQQIHLAAESNAGFQFELKRREIRTEEVEIVGPNPAEWRRLLKRFTNAFLGETGNALHCSILNPYHLNLKLDEEQHTFTARCDTVLLVENDALGYRIAIDLEEFEWDVKDDIIRYSLYPRFEELPRTPDDSLRWKKRREETYRGSLRHFLRSVVTGTVSDEMFAVYTGGLSELLQGNGLYVPPEELRVVPDRLPGVFQWSFSGWLRIDYKGRIPPTRSFLTLLAPSVQIDLGGIVLTRFGTFTRGEWSRSRIADLLPLY